VRPSTLAGLIRGRADGGSCARCRMAEIGRGRLGNGGGRSLSDVQILRTARVGCRTTIGRVLALHTSMVGLWQRIAIDARFIPKGRRIANSSRPARRSTRRFVRSDIGERVSDERWMTAYRALTAKPASNELAGGHGRGGPQGCRERPSRRAALASALGRPASGWLVAEPRS